MTEHTWIVVTLINYTKKSRGEFWLKQEFNGQEEERVKTVKTYWASDDGLRKSQVQYTVYVYMQDLLVVYIPDD